MKIECSLTGTVLRKNEKVGKNGTHYFSLLILQTEEANNFPCTPEVFAQAVEGQNMTFDMDYSEGMWNGQPYRNIKLVDVVPFVDEKKAVAKQA